MASDSVTRVCLMGHSYIRRLRDFMDSNASYKNLNLDSSFRVNIRAREGLTFRRIYNCLEFSYRRPLPFASCSCDLCTDTPEKVIKNIREYASYMYLKEGVWMLQIGVGKLLRWQPWALQNIFGYFITHGRR